MKTQTTKTRKILNLCKYCGNTEIDIYYNRFNNQDHCSAKCKCGAFVQRYCTNLLIAEQLEPTVVNLWNAGEIGEPIK